MIEVHVRNVEGEYPFELSPGIVCENTEQMTAHYRLGSKPQLVVFEGKSWTDGIHAIEGDLDRMGVEEYVIKGPDDEIYAFRDKDGRHGP